MLWLVRFIERPGASDALNRAGDVSGVATMTTIDRADVSMPSSRLVEQTTARSSLVLNRFDP